ncbi:MAG: DUF418 domain-containing protein [Bacteroidetes bacterium]|nr:MAG: DUF418 domain-containing protein [Bacteroidota bacterium]
MLEWVLLIWAVSFLGTKAWLRFYEQGPLESIWRKHTYWSKSHA